MLKDKNFGVKNFIRENRGSTTENIGRIIQKNNHLYTIATLDQIIHHVKAAHKLKDKDFYVGDFVLFNQQDDECLLVELLERKSVISKASSHAAKSYHVTSFEQILATNVDQLYIVIAADQRFTLSKFERYMMTFHQEHVELIVLLSKADYEVETKDITRTIHASYANVKIMPVSIHQPETVQKVKDSLMNGQTAMFIGASGVGKSTLVNDLTNDLTEDTNVVRTDGKGKHTTTVTKMLYMHETDSVLIDSPGFKTISTTREMDGSILFAEIQDLGEHCKFTDCTHNHEPGCAVIQAVKDGDLSAEQVARYGLYEKKLKGMQKHENRKQMKKQKVYSKK